MPSRPARARRRAVGPPGAAPSEEPRLGLAPDPPEDGEQLTGDPAIVERYRREQPPHHDRGV